MRNPRVKALVAGFAPLLSVPGLASCGGSSAATSTLPPTTTETPTTTTTVPLLCGDKAVTGPETQMDWGAKSFGTVTATAFVNADGSLCGATAGWNAILLISEEITAEAVPVLNARVEKSHTAKVNAVSGATATSRAYVKSLQAALDSQ